MSPDEFAMTFVFVLLMLGGVGACLLVCHSLFAPSRISM